MAGLWKTNASRDIINRVLHPVKIGLIFFSALVIAVFGCSPSTPDDGNNNVTGDNETTSSDEWENTLVEVGDIAYQFALKLGYEADLLQIGQRNIFSEENENYWEVELEYTDGPLAYVLVNTLSGSVEAFTLMIPSNEISPPALRPGEDIAERVSDALGLEESRYVKVEAIPEQEGSAGFIRIEEVSNWEITSGEVQIFFNPETYAFAGITLWEAELPDSLEINIDDSTAIEIVRSHYVIESREDVTAELVFRIPDDPSEHILVWEVLIDHSVTYVNPSNGEIIG